MQRRIVTQLLLLTALLSHALCAMAEDEAILRQRNTEMWLRHLVCLESVKQQHARQGKVPPPKQYQWQSKQAGFDGINVEFGKTADSQKQCGMIHVPDLTAKGVLQRMAQDLEAAVQEIAMGAPAKKIDVAHFLLAMNVHQMVTSWKEKAIQGQGPMADLVRQNDLVAIEYARLAAAKLDKKRASPGGKNARATARSSGGTGRLGSFNKYDNNSLLSSLLPKDLSLPKGITEPEGQESSLPTNAEGATIEVIDGTSAKNSHQDRPGNRDKKRHCRYPDEDFEFEDEELPLCDPTDEGIPATAGGTIEDDSWPMRLPGKIPGESGQGWSERGESRRPWPSLPPSPEIHEDYPPLTPDPTEHGSVDLPEQPGSTAGTDFGGPTGSGLPTEGGHPGSGLPTEGGYPNLPIPSMPVEPGGPIAGMPSLEDAREQAGGQHSDGGPPSGQAPGQGREADWQDARDKAMQKFMSLQAGPNPAYSYRDQSLGVQAFGPEYCVGDEALCAQSDSMWRQALQEAQQRNQLGEGG